MKTLLRTLFSLTAVAALNNFILPSAAQGATVVTATITVTNVAQVGTNWIVNGNTRTWTNNTGTPPSSWIQTTNTESATASNLYSHIVRFPYLTPMLTVQRTSPTNIVLRGSSVSVTTNNYFSVSYQTNTGTNLSVVQVPFENVVGDTNRTNNAHWLVDALNRFPYTNALATNANVITNLLVKGAHPYQEVLGPVGFRGRTAVNSNFFATNGFTANLTNINPVFSNGVNFGNALRSEGSGGNSLQIGSNAVAAGDLSVAIGNDSKASNANSIAFGTSARATNDGAIAVGTSTSAGGVASIGIGQNRVVRQEGAIGLGANVNGFASVGIGYANTVDGSNSAAILGTVTSDFALAVGYLSAASALNAAAFGTGAAGSHSNSAAIGPQDDAGTVVATTTTNQIRIGTSRHTISGPGLFESPKQTNSQFAGTNVARGSWSFPAFSLTSLAAGNNISVPFGTNRFIRCGSGPVSAATICGIIGGATSGGLDGQDILVMNDTGFVLTFAVNTVDPVAANRINTPNGADVVISDQGWARLTYDGTDSRWKLTGTYPLIDYRSVSVVSGAGTGNTNYTLQAVAAKSILGSSNVNIVAVMQTVPGTVINWSANITNLSAINWGIGFSSVTNRWKFNHWLNGTNAPSVLSNNCILRLNGECYDTNTLVTYEYFTPGL